MGVASTYNEKANTLFVRLWGDVSFEEESGAVAAILADPRLLPNFKLLVDRTESISNASLEEMKIHAALVKEKLKSLPGVRVAIIAPSDLEYGSARMFEAVAEGQIDHDFMVFREPQEAIEFLELDPDLVEWPQKE